MRFLKLASGNYVNIETIKLISVIQDKDENKWAVCINMNEIYDNEFCIVKEYHTDIEARLAMNTLVSKLSSEVPMTL